jgi:DNA-binding transcriptional ArsR family regulator
MLKALGDVHRLDMLHVLAAASEMTVTDLAETLINRGRYISQPLVSWHLNILRRAGLVRTRRTGRQVHCSLDRNRYQHCLRLLSDVIAVPATTAAAATATTTATAPVTLPERPERYTEGPAKTVQTLKATPQS